MYRIYAIDPVTKEEHLEKYMSGNISMSLDDNYDVKGNKPKIGCQLKIESLGSREFRITSPVTEIIKEEENKVEFKTRNTYYIWEEL